MWYVIAFTWWKYRAKAINADGCQIVKFLTKSNYNHKNSKIYLQICYSTEKNKYYRRAPLFIRKIK